MPTKYVRSKYTAQEIEEVFDDVRLGETIQGIPVEGILVYYGYPVSYKGLWDVDKVVYEIKSKYKIVVFGDNYQDPDHEEYESTKSIIQKLIDLRVEVFGYVPIGVSTSNRDMATMQQAVDDWKTLKCTGIFIDEFGFDYEVDRQRQIDLVNYVHSKGMNYIGNCWTIQDMVCDSDTELPSEWADDDWRRTNFHDHNPDNLPLSRNDNDYWMYENFVYSENGVANMFDTFEKLTLYVLPYLKNIRIVGLSIVAETDPGVIDMDKYVGFPDFEEMTKYAWVIAYASNFHALGCAGFSIGSAGGDVAIEYNYYRLPDRIMKSTWSMPVFSSVDKTLKTNFSCLDQYTVFCDTDNNTYWWDVTANGGYSILDKEKTVHLDPIGESPLADNSFFVDKTDGVLKFRDSNGEIKQVSLV